MRALLFAHSDHDPIDPNLYLPPVMYPFVDRPFLQHVIEILVAQGVQSIDLILAEPPEMIEHLVGNGRRWGISINSHLVPPQRTPYHVAALLADYFDEEPLLVVHADTLISFEFLSLSNQPDEILFYGHPSSLLPERWTGWAWLYPGALRQFISSPITAATRHNFFTFLRNHRRAPQGAAPLIQFLDSQVLSVTPDLLFPSQRLALVCADLEPPALPSPNLLRSGRSIAPGIWAGAQTKIDPDVTLVPPVFIGAQSRIKSGVTLGPNTVVGARCLLDSQSSLRDALIFNDVYLGPGLIIDDALITPHHIVHPSPGPSRTASATGATQFISPIDEKTLLHLFGQATLRTLAILFFLLALPALLMLHLYARHRQAPGLTRESSPPIDPSTSPFPPVPPLLTLRLPHPSHGPWHYLFCHLLPGLWHIARSEIRLFGISRATAKELNHLPEHWRNLLTPIPVGLITEPLVTHVLQGPEHPRLAADLFYAAFQSPTYNLRLLGRFLKSLITALLPLRLFRQVSQ